MTKVEKAETEERILPVLKPGDVSIQSSGFRTPRLGGRDFGWLRGFRPPSFKS